MHWNSNQNYKNQGVKNHCYYFGQKIEKMEEKRKNN